MEKYESETRQDMRGNKQFNDFFSPMQSNTEDGKTQQDADGEFEFHMQIGSKLYPSFSIMIIPESMFLALIGKVYLV